MEGEGEVEAKTRAEALAAASFKVIRGCEEIPLQLDGVRKTMLLKGMNVAN